MTFGIEQNTYLNISHVNLILSKSMPQPKTLVALAFSVLLMGLDHTALAQTHIIQIDNFDGNHEVSDVAPADSRATSAVQAFPSAAVLGGFRKYSAQLTMCPGLTVSGNSVGCFTDQGYFNHQAYPLACGRSKLTWDGDNIAGTLNTIGLGGIDLGDPALGLGFRINIESADRPCILNFTIHSGPACSQGSIPIAAPFFEPHLFTLPFSAMTACSGTSAANVHTTGAITLEIDGTAYHSLDLSLNSLEIGCALLDGLGNPTCLTPTATPTATTTPTFTLTPSNTVTAISIKTATPLGLRLTSLCSEQPDITRRWKILNPNSFTVEGMWELLSTPARTGLESIPANSQIIFDTITTSGANTLKIYSINALAVRVLEDSKTSSGAICPTPTSTASPTAVGAATPTPTITPSMTPSLTPTSIASPTETPVPSPSPTSISTNTYTATATAAATQTSTATATHTATDTPSPTISSTNTPTPTSIVEPTTPPEATMTSTPTPISTNTSTPIPTMQFTRTSTPTPQPTLELSPTPTTPPNSSAQCTTHDLTTLLFGLDGGAVRSQAAIKTAISASTKAKFISERTGRLILDQSQHNYLSAWQNTWAIPRIIISCEDGSPCTTVSLLPQQANYRKAVDALFKIGQDLSKRLTAIGGKTLRITKRLNSEIKTAHDENLKLLRSAPASTSKC